MENLVIIATFSFIGLVVFVILAGVILSSLIHKKVSKIKRKINSIIPGTFSTTSTVPTSVIGGKEILSNFDKSGATKNPFKLYSTEAWFGNFNVSSIKDEEVSKNFLKLKSLLSLSKILFLIVAGVVALGILAFFLTVFLS